MGKTDICYKLSAIELSCLVRLQSSQMKWCTLRLRLHRKPEALKRFIPNPNVNSVHTCKKKPQHATLGCIPFSNGTRAQNKSKMYKDEIL